MTREHALPVPDVVSSTEGGAILGVTRQRFEQLAASDPAFPEPVARLGKAGRRVWSGPAVAEYGARPRRPGRPWPGKAAER